MEAKKEEAKATKNKKKKSKAGPAKEEEQKKPIAVQKVVEAPATNVADVLPFEEVKERVKKPKAPRR